MAFKVLYTTLSFYDCSLNDNGLRFWPSSNSSLLIFSFGAGGSSMAVLVEEAASLSLWENPNGDGVAWAKLEGASSLSIPLAFAIWWLMAMAIKPAVCSSWIGLKKVAFGLSL